MNPLRNLKKIFLGLLTFLFVVAILFFTPLEIPSLRKAKLEGITWGVSFSQKHAQALGLNWQETYLALLNDLQVKNLRLAVHWDLIEPAEGEYNFEDLDWQIKEAENHEARLILIVGMKTGRWPECHLPQWVVNLEKERQQEKILTLLEKVVSRYKDYSSIEYWQVENEPLYPFGTCPWRDKKFLREEVALVKSLDTQQRPIIINSTGEWSLWFKEAEIGDAVGTSLYRIIWSQGLNSYVYYPFPPGYFWARTRLIEKLFNKEVICVELQAEPWGPTLLYDSPPEEQEKTMNLEQFRKNIEFGRKTGLNKFFLWGGEWWYWLKTQQDKPEIWNEAKGLFKTLD